MLVKKNTDICAFTVCCEQLIDEEEMTGTLPCRPACTGRSWPDNYPDPGDTARLRILQELYSAAFQRPQRPGSPLGITPTPSS